MEDKDHPLGNGITYYCGGGLFYEANRLYECYSKENPLTREQWADAIKANQQYPKKKYNVFLGEE